MRVLVVGAGPAGLVLAHMLPLAGIDDFIVLERRADILEPSGAGVGLWPHSVRVLNQLGNGILEEARNLAPKMRRSLRLGGPKADLVLANDLFEQIEEKSDTESRSLISCLLTIQIVTGILSCCSKGHGLCGFSSSDCPPAARRRS